MEPTGLVLPSPGIPKRSGEPRTPSGLVRKGHPGEMGGSCLLVTAVEPREQSLGRWGGASGPCVSGSCGPDSATLRKAGVREGQLSTLMSGTTSRTAHEQVCRGRRSVSAREGHVTMGNKQPWISVAETTKVFFSLMVTQAQAGGTSSRALPSPSLCPGSGESEGSGVKTTGSGMMVDSRELVQRHNLGGASGRLSRRAGQMCE